MKQMSSYLTDDDVIDSLRRDGISCSYKSGKWVRECSKLFTQYDSRLMQLLDLFNENQSYHRLHRQHMNKLTVPCFKPFRLKPETYVLDKTVLEQMRMSIEMPVKTLEKCKRDIDLDRPEFLILRDLIILCALTLSLANYYHQDGLDDMFSLYNEIHLESLAQLKFVMLKTTRETNVRIPLDVLNGHTVLGMVCYITV